MDFQRTFALSSVLLGILYRLYASSSIFTTLSEIRRTDHNTSWLDSWFATTTTGNWYSNLDKIMHKASREETTVHNFVFFNAWEIFHNIRSITTRAGGMQNKIQ
jgi:hypothetical protein